MAGGALSVLEGGGDNGINEQLLARNIIYSKNNGNGMEWKERE